MRYLKDNCLKSMSSPIRFVMKHIHNALVNVAPERKSKFEDELKDFTLEYCDVDQWICNVNPDAHHIRLSRQVAEIQWVAAYSYILLYTKVAQNKKPVTREIIDLTKDAKVAEAMKLLKWSYGNMLDGKNYTPWPCELPHPIENPDAQSMEKIADEVCLVALASLIHHELAHIRLGHKASMQSIENEREADYEMADWILDHSIEIKDMRFIKRSLGIAIAFETMIACGIYKNNYGGLFHPPFYDRLIHTLSPYIKDHNHVVWSVIVVAIKLHMDNVNIDTPDCIYSTFYECVNSYADILSYNIR